jgi:hypothetical protein
VYFPNEVGCLGFKEIMKELIVPFFGFMDD